MNILRLAEPAAVRRKLGLPVERDQHFIADKSISAYRDLLRKTQDSGK